MIHIQKITILNYFILDSNLFLILNCQQLLVGSKLLPINNCTTSNLYLIRDIDRAGHDTQKMYNRYNYNYTLFSYNRYYYNYFKKNNSRYNYKYRIFLVDTS